MTRIAIATCCLLLLGACNSAKKTDASEYREPQSEKQGRQRGGPPDAGSTISKMDQNGDGKLSISEVEGRLKEKFGTIDSNGDGFVTKTELENARPQRGQGRPPRG